MAESVNDFTTWTVDQLKAFLRERNIPLSGNKAELVRKATDVFATDSLEREMEAVPFQQVEYSSPPSLHELSFVNSWVSEGFPTISETAVTVYLKARSGYTKNFRTGSINVLSYFGHYILQALCYLLFDVLYHRMWSHQASQDEGVVKVAETESNPTNCTQDIVVAAPGAKLVTINDNRSTALVVQGFNIQDLMVVYAKGSTLSVLTRYADYCDDSDSEVDDESDQEDWISEESDKEQTDNACDYQFVYGEEQFQMAFNHSDVAKMPKEPPASGIDRILHSQGVKTGVMMRWPRMNNFAEKNDPKRGWGEASMLNHYHRPKMRPHRVQTSTTCCVQCYEFSPGPLRPRVHSI